MSRSGEELKCTKADAQLSTTHEPFWNKDHLDEDAQLYIYVSKHELYTACVPP